ncbi:MAG: DNA polymerase III subunit delta' [Thermodesulfobacteriota bacterium]
MTGFDDIQGQEGAVTLLKQAVSCGRIPNAWMFAGPQGVGKMRTARALALVLNCETRHPSSATACGECSSCRTLAGGNHPDLIVIEPEKHEIRVAQIRSVCAALEKKAFATRKRLVVLDQAERMNPGAANAALKILEEPPDNTHFVLVAEEIENVLPTIRSRCQQVTFGPLPHRTIVTLLQQEHGIDAETSKRIASVCSGSMKRALLMAETKWFLWREWVLDGLEQMDRFHPSERLLFGELLLSRADHLDETLDWMAGWYRDALCIRYGSSRLLNVDRRESIARAVQHRTTRDLTETLAALTRMRRKTHGRANLKLMMDNLVLTLA